MKLTDLRFLPRAIERKALYFIIGSLLSVPFYFAARHLDLLASYPTELSIALTGGIITIALLVASLLRFVPDFKDKKSSSFPVLYPLTLIMFSVLMATAANVLNNMVYFALYFLMLGIVLFLNEIREIVSEHTIGVSLLDKITFDSSSQKSPRLQGVTHGCRFELIPRVMKLTPCSTWRTSADNASLKSGVATAA